MSSLHSDRCFKPFNIPGHIGKDLRKVSKSVLEEYVTLHTDSRICSQCRKRRTSNSTTQSLNVSDNNTDSDIGTESNIAIKKPRYSRQDQLEQLLDGLKKKHVSLPTNDPLRLSILTTAPDCWTLREIATEFGTSVRQAAAGRELKNKDGVLALPRPKKGKNIPDETIKEVIKFYNSDEKSRIMPNKKDVVSVKIDGEKMTFQKRLLLCDVKVLHTEFKSMHPEMPIGLTKFAELRPKQCVLAGAKGTHSVCVCVKHQNFKALIDGANVLKKGDGSSITGKNYKDCFEFVLCAESKSCCYFNECASCPEIQNFSDHVSTLLNSAGIEMVIFSTWQSTDRCTLKKECLDIEDFVVKLCDDLQNLLPHHYIAQNQSKVLQDFKVNLQEDEVVVQCDFSENYAYVAQDAAQAFHYNNDQCSIHTVIFYYTCDSEIKHCNAILLSPCTIHDAAAVYIMQQHLIPLIKLRCPAANKIVYFTDGAKQHYKNRYQMSNLANHKNDFGLNADWHFHATAHGKGPCDGLGAILKREATRASLQAKSNEAILDSQELYKWSKKKFPTIELFYYDKKQHSSTKKFLAKRFSNAPAVPNIQKGHAFIINSNDQLNVYRYSGAAEPLTVLQY